ncbi:MAG: hypothetical protein QQW96_22230 [Tychonema bourrellyi B0820]|nr:hypothetical protein [Tychonema bourrellyi B0820]
MRQPCTGEWPFAPTIHGKRLVRANGHSPLRTLQYLYGIWAYWRLPLTGRPDLATVMGDRAKRIECNNPSRCRVNDEV